MKRLVFFYLMISLSFISIAQEKKEVKQLDSIQIKLEQAIQEQLKNTPKELNIIVLKDILKKLTPKKVKPPEQEGWKSNGKFLLQ